MKKRILVIISTLLLLLVGFGFNANQAKAAWGAKSLYTTPIATRGTWYYKQKGKIKTLKINAHTLNGVKLYKALSDKEENKWAKKLVKADKKSGYKLADKVGLSQYETYSFTYRGRKGFNACGWLASGNGIYYAPVKKIIHGKRVNALRLGNGYHNFLKYYVYQNKNLLK